MNKARDSRSAAVFFLVLITAIWGWSFVIVKESVSLYPVFSFLALRFFLGAAILSLFIGRSFARFDGKLLAAGVVLGLFLFGGYAFQTTGLLYTTPAHSGFITGLFVVFTPLFESFTLKKRPPWIIVGSLLLSTTGLVVLSYEPDLKGMNYGDFLSLMCAIIYSFHLILIDRLSKRYNTLHLAFLQVLTVSLLSFASALVTGCRLAPIPGTSLNGVLLTALFATALSYYVQTTYQKVTSATEAALIFTLEPVFAGMFAYFMWGEKFSGRIYAGGAMILTGMLISQARSLMPAKTGG